jgi:hypothetical protein
MKLFKNASNEIFAYELDGSQDDLIGDKTPITQEEADAIRAQKQQAAFNALTYQEKRMIEYPNLNEQMDMLFHKGFDYWKQQIELVKNKYPKTQQ